MSPRSRIIAAGFAVALSTVGCSKLFGEAPTYLFQFTIRVVSDDGTPIRGAELGAGSNRGAVTDATGQARLEVRGREGDRRSFPVRCPKEFQSPVQPMLISLHQNAEGAKNPVYGATCVPLKRTAVVAVRLLGGAGLPIYYLDQEVARTDESGAAHFIVHAVPGEPFRVVVKTQEIDEDLRPVDPSAELSVGPADDIVLFEQKLTRAVRYVPPPARRRRLLPQRL